MDVETTEPGIDFVEAIENTMAAADAVLVLIGPRWSEFRDASGTRRLENPSDVVRLEVQAALAGDKPVIPVLVAGATMPQPQDLPAEISHLARRTAFELSDSHFETDIRRLLEFLRGVSVRSERATQEPSSEVESLDGAFGGPARATAGEHRHVTVMFCDMVGSTALGQKLDLEDLHELMQDYQRICTEVISEFHGHIDQYQGDGLLVYFGYPRAHEGDAERAAHAALGIIEAISDWNARLADGGVQIAVRIALHSGPVLVGGLAEGPAGTKQVLGHTINLASRLQNKAEADTAVTSKETLRLIQGSFITQDLGEHPLKGVIAPVGVYRLERPRAMRSRIADFSEAELTPLVGREQEIGLLWENFEQTKEGRGQVVILRGEEGVGKTRLLNVFRSRLSAEPHTWLECQCSPYHDTSAFYPLIQLLEQGLDLAAEPSEEAKISKLEAALRLADEGLAETLPDVAGLLSLPIPDCYSASALSPDARRRRIFDILASWIFSVCEIQPVIMVAEDLQWGGRLYPGLHPEAGRRMSRGQDLPRADASTGIRAQVGAALARNSADPESSDAPTDRDHDLTDRRWTAASGNRADREDGRWSSPIRRGADEESDRIAGRLGR